MVFPRTRWISVLVLTLLASPLGWSQSTTLATINGEILTEADVRATAASEFEAIDTEDDSGDEDGK